MSNFVNIENEEDLPTPEQEAATKAEAKRLLLEAVNEFRIYHSRAELQRTIDRYFGTVEEPIAI